MHWTKFSWRSGEHIFAEMMELHQKYGKAISTPDFLLNTPILLDDTEIKWIDAKNFYGSDSKFIKSKILKQTKKYINKWRGDMPQKIFSLEKKSIYPNPNGELFCQFTQYLPEF